MNSIETYQDKINIFVNDLCSKKDFAHLSIRINTYVRTKAETKNSIESNANIGIKNSLMADSMISNYIDDLFKDYEGNDKYLFRIFFIDIGKKDVKAKTGNSDDEVIEKFLVEKPKYKLSSVILPKHKWDEINHALNMIKNHTKVYKDWGFEEIEPSAKTILCFYGKPGTGKTKCAHGIAEYFNKMILCASYADIQSQYVGVGPKNLRNIFKQAEKEDAVLFFDEADAFLRKRSSDTSSSAAMHYNSMTNEMMKHLEDFNGLVIFATNLTENIDDAFMTRITASIEFPIPDLETRAVIIKELIPKKAPLNDDFSEEEYINIAKKCDGFVGRDIRNAIKATLSDAAESNLEVLTPKEFEDGFEKYKISKDDLEHNVNGDTQKNSIYEQIEWNTANSSVLAICSYLAWFDGPETEEETIRLKQIAKQLNRDKLIITKLTDLPTLEDMCERIKLQKQKIEIIDYATSILALSNKDEVNYDLLQKLCNALLLKEEIQNKAKELLCNYKTIYSIKKEINESELYN